MLKERGERERIGRGPKGLKVPLQTRTQFLELAWALGQKWVEFKFHKKRADWTLKYSAQWAFIARFRRRPEVLWGGKPRALRFRRKLGASRRICHLDRAHNVLLHRRPHRHRSRNSAPNSGFPMTRLTVRDRGNYLTLLWVS